MQIHCMPLMFNVSHCLWEMFASMLDLFQVTVQLHQVACDVFLFQYRLVQNPGALTISYTKELTSGNPEWKLNISHLAMTVTESMLRLSIFSKNFTF